MLIALHKNARTTPAVRAEIAASTETAPVLAQRYGISEQTVYKWKKREAFGDRSHIAHRLQTVLSPAQEAIVVQLRRTLLLPLDDLLAVSREFLCPAVSRSGLDRCLRRHGVGNLNALKPQEPVVSSKTFKSYEPGYVHVDVKYLPQMQDESSRRYLFVAIDRATRWVFVQLKSNKTAASARAFLSALHKACPIKITRLLTDNGKEFTDRLFASREREASGNHGFDQLCRELGIEHRLARPRTPRTNGMVERFNGRIADVLRTHRFNSRDDLEQTLLRYVALYNHQLPQSALKSKTPLQAMKDWHQTHPHLFNKRPYDRPGCDSYEPGYVHVDVKYLPQMQDESSRRYLFVAIDRATRWVYVALKANKTAASAQSFLKALHKACPIKIHKLLTDNGKEFTDRLFASRERQPSGNHEFDQLCDELGIEHRLTKPRTPRTNGMVERFNGRIADVLKTHRFNSREDMEQTLLRYVALYNHQLPQSALGSKTPMQAMKQWYQESPHLFHKRPYDRPGCDIYASNMPLEC